MLSLITVLQSVHDTTTCLMRLSKPLLDNHRRHQGSAGCGDGDETHHVSHLQSLLPNADLTTLKQLSHSICARRLEVLLKNGYRGGRGSALHDDAFLRPILLELASACDKSMKHHIGIGSSLEARSYDQADSSSFADARGTEFPSEWRSSTSIRQGDQVFNIPEYVSRKPESGAQLRKSQDHEVELHDKQEVGKASVLSHKFLTSKSRSSAIPACTRCRAVSSWRGH
jgi:hypothetical protein